MGNHNLINVSDPVSNQDVATMAYVLAHGGSNYNASYLTSTFNATYDAKTNYNSSYWTGSNYNASYWTGTNYNSSYLTSSFNSTYDSKPSSTYNVTYDGLIGDTGYSISLQSLSGNPSKNTYGYIGNQPIIPATSANIRNIYIPKAGTITRVDLVAYATSTAGSNENINTSLSKNNGAWNSIQTVGVNTAQRHFVNTNMNLAVVAGDYIEIRLGYGNWGTPPTAVTWEGSVYVAT
jgi:hypothetical protein